MVSARRRHRICRCHQEEEEKEEEQEEQEVIACYLLAVPFTGIRAVSSIIVCYMLCVNVKRAGEKVRVKCVVRRPACRRTLMQSSSTTSFTVNGERSVSSRQRLRDTGQSSGLGEFNHETIMHATQ